MSAKTNLLLVERILHEHVDTLLISRQFTRGRSKTDYHRSLVDSTQSIDFNWTKARYSDDPSVLHLHPVLILDLPEVNSRVRDLVGDVTLIGNAIDTTLTMAIGLTGPERRLADWRVISEAFIGNIGTSVADFLNNWTLPFLEEYQNAEDLARGFERNDDRFPRGDIWLIKIAACYMLIGERPRAKKILFDAFHPKLGLRKKYSHVLQAVAEF